MISFQILECMKTMERGIPQKTKAEFMSSAYSQIEKYHFVLGLWIWNNILCQDESLYKSFATLGITDMDDISDLLLRLFYIYLTQKDR